MTVAELSALLARCKKTDIITSIDGWVLIGPSRKRCIDAWMRQEARSAPVQPVPETFQVSKKVVAILPE